MKLKSDINPLAFCFNHKKQLLMKQLLSILLITFSIFGCSSDDSNISTDKQLKKITSFSIKDGKEQKTAEHFFENGKEVSGKLLLENQKTLEYSNTYNNLGLLIESKSKGGNILTDDETSTTEYSYDKKNRLIKITSSSFSSKKNTRDFSYNSDNTITGTTFLGNNITYFLNNSGLIFKEITSFTNENDSISSIIETLATYKNDLITKINTTTGNELFENKEYSFEYDETIKPKNGVNIQTNQFGSKNNNILATDIFLSSFSGNCKEFRTKTIFPNFENTTTYSFDENEYLIKSETFRDGKKIGFSNYQYN